MVDIRKGKVQGIPLIPLLFQPVAHMHPGQDIGYLGSLQPLSSIGHAYFHGRSKSKSFITSQPVYKMKEKKRT